MKRFLIAITFILLLATQSWAVWVERFVETVGGGDGSSSYTVTAAVADGVWTAASKTLHHDASFVTALGAATQYLYISSATAGTAGLYTIASITSDDEYILGTLVSGVGIAANQNDVVCGTGPWTIVEAIAGVAAGQRVNVRAASYPNMAADYAFATAGTTTAPIWWRGYKTVIGDKDTAGGTRVPGVDLPLFNSDTATDQIVVSGAHQIFSNISVTSVCTDAGGAINATGGNLRFIRCQIENTAANANSRALSTATNGPVILIGCRLKATTTAANVTSGGVVTYLLGCHILGGAVGIYYPNMVHSDHCVIEGFATSGIELSSASNPGSVWNTTIYAVATNAILVSSIPTTGHLIVANSILGGCTNGINNSTAGNTNGVTLIRNHFYACTNNIVKLTELADVTADLGVALFLLDDDTDPFVAKAGNDFTLVSTAIDRSAGYPGLFEGQTLMIGYPDIGAVRHVDPSSSGGKFISYLLGEPIRSETEFVARLFGKVK